MIAAAFLLDTNVISETRKMGRSRVVMDWLASIQLADIWTTTASMAELEYRAAVLEDIPLRRSIESWITEVVRPWFGDRIYGIDENALQRWLMLIAQAKKDQRRAPMLTSCWQQLLWKTG